MASDLLQEIREAGRSYIVVYKQFLSECKKGSPILFCFFEGEDDRTYYARQISCHTSYLHYVCNGKGNVVRVHTLISKNKDYRQTKTAYFVDSDFDTSLNINSIFETPAYSIENAYSEGLCFNTILTDRFKISRKAQDGSVNPDYEQSIKLYRELQNTFHKKIGLLNAWLACQAKSPNNQKLNIGKNAVLNGIIKDVVTRHLILAPLDEIDSIQKLESIFPEAIPITLDRVTNMLNELNVKGPALYFRGKFELNFFRSFLFSFKSNISFKTEHKLSRKYNTSGVRLPVDESDLIQNYAGIAFVFPNLNSYILDRIA